MQFSNTAQQQLYKNKHATKTVNPYIVYELDAWPRIPLNNFKLKFCLFGSTNIAKNSNKEK